MSLTFDPQAFVKADEKMLAEIDKNLSPHIQKMSFEQLRDYCDSQYRRANGTKWSVYHLILAFILGAACVTLLLLQ